MSSQVNYISDLEECDDDFDETQYTRQKNTKIKVFEDTDPFDQKFNPARPNNPRSSKNTLEESINRIKLKPRNN